MSELIDVKGKTFAEIEIQQAIEWFKENCCHAYEDIDGVYIEVGDDCEVQVSASEVSYRADLYRGLQENK
jgi:hypothetical protein